MGIHFEKLISEQYMDLSTIDHIPRDVQYYIHGFVPYHRCTVCKADIIEFSRSPDMYICSIFCLTKFNTEMMTRMKYNRGVIITHNLSLYAQYAVSVSYVTITIVIGFICPLSVMMFVLYHGLRLLLFMAVNILFG